jgi:hypothetical protein
MNTSAGFSIDTSARRNGVCGRGIQHCYCGQAGCNSLASFELRDDLSFYFTLGSIREFEYTVSEIISRMSIAAIPLFIAIVLLHLGRARY